jgi:hypothetical protein
VEKDPKWDAVKGSDTTMLIEKQMPVQKIFRAGNRLGKKQHKAAHIKKITIRTPANKNSLPFAPRYK